MMAPGMRLVTDYWDDDLLKSSFIQFVNDIFRLDFTIWDSMGYWDPHYKPFSLFDGNTMIANVCLYTLPCLLHGKETMVTQISAVATHADHRKTGLANMLLKEAMSQVNHDNAFIFLYANPEAQGFYDKNGFTSLGSQVAVMDLEESSSKVIPGTRQLDPGDHKFLFERVGNSEPVSDVFSSLSDKLTMFHLLLSYPDRLYYIEPMDMLLVMERANDTMVIYDLIAREVLPFNEWRSYLDLEGIRRVLFRFNPDKLVEGAWHKKVIQNGLNIFAPNPAYNELVFPALIQA